MSYVPVHDGFLFLLRSGLVPCLNPGLVSWFWWGMFEKEHGAQVPVFDRDHSA